MNEVIIKQKHAEMSSQIKRGSKQHMPNKYNYSYSWNYAEALKGSKKTPCWVTQSWVWAPSAQCLSTFIMLINHSSPPTFSHTPITIYLVDRCTHIKSSKDAFKSKWVTTTTTIKTLLINFLCLILHLHFLLLVLLSKGVHAVGFTTVIYCYRTTIKMFYLFFLFKDCNVEKLIWQLDKECLYLWWGKAHMSSASFLTCCAVFVMKLK